MATTEYYHKNKEWINNNRKRKYQTVFSHRENIKFKSRKYRKENLQKVRLMNRLYKQNNKEKLKIYRKKNRLMIYKTDKQWRKNNSNKVKEYSKRSLKKQRLKFPEKNKARKFTHYHKLKDNECKKCKYKKNLHFHHTNYKKNKGFTLCARCHSLLHH